MVKRADVVTLEGTRAEFCLTAEARQALLERFGRTEEGFAVRQLRPRDCPDWRALMLATFSSDPTAFLSTVSERAPLPLSWWEDRLTGEDGEASLVMGAWHEGALIGVVGALPGDRERTRHKATVFGMAVDAAFRNLGVGRLLLTRLLTELHQTTSVRAVSLTVTEGNEAATRLYRSLGFTPYGVEPMAMRIGREDIAKVHLWKRLPE